MTIRLTAPFSSTEKFLEVYRTEISAGGLLIRGAELPPNAPAGRCEVELRIDGRAPVVVEASIAASIPGIGVAVLFLAPAPIDELAHRLQSGGEQGAEETEGEAPAEDEPAEDEPEPEPEHHPPGTMGARIRAMSVAEKMQLGLSGDRDARTHLFRDTNKSIHLYVLRNPRIGLDEVQAAAKMATLSPEAIKYIAEHKEWGHNAVVCAAIARNPKAPVPLVVRLLPRVPLQELRVIAKGTGRAPIVQAARKLINK